jgi:beta-N-acetylhexosaminidase
MMRSLAAKVLLIGIDGKDLKVSERDFLQKTPPAGLILFRRNIPETFARLKGQIDLYRGYFGSANPMIAIDQEGGRVSRLGAPFPNQGPALHLFENEDENVRLHKIENYGYVIGAALRALGINVNFAPVTDLMVNPANSVVADRAFGETPDEVSDRAGAFLAGMSASGVQGCLKHFPGQGAGSQDTHHGEDTINVAWEDLASRELVPFKRLMNRCHMIMMSHSRFPVVDDKPASLSHQWMTGILRNDWNYQGLILTDDMNMKAIGQEGELFKSKVVQAIEAGADLVLVCQSWEHVLLATDAVEAEAKVSPAFASRLKDAAARVDRLRSQLF